MTVRNSTSNQKDNASRRDQLERGKEFGEARNGTFVKEVYDNKSGTTLDRLGIEEVHQLLDSGIASTVIFYDMSRATRGGSIDAQSLFKQIYSKGGKIGVVTRGQVFETYREAIIGTHWDASLAQFFALETRNKTDVGRVLTMSHGGWVNRCMYGYKLAKETVNGIRLKKPVVLPHERDVVRYIFQRAMEGAAKVDITAELNEAGHLTKTGKSTFSSTTIHNIIKNARLYAGFPFMRRIRIDEETYEQEYSYPPLLTVEEYTKVANNDKLRPRKNRKYPKPFKGIFRCSHCQSSAMVRYPKHHKDGRLSYIFICGTNNRYKNYLYTSRQVNFEVCRSSISSNVIKPILIEYLAGFRNGLLGNNAYKLELARFILQYQANLIKYQTLKDELDALSEKKDHVIDSALMAKQNDLNDLLTSFNDKIRRINAEIASKSTVVQDFSAVLETQRIVISRLGVETPANKVRELFQQMDDLEIIVTLEWFNTVDYRQVTADIARYGTDFAKKLWTEIQLSLQEPLKNLQSNLDEVNEALDKEDWLRANKLLLDLGVLITADFSETNKTQRTKSIKVSFDYALLEGMMNYGSKIPANGLTVNSLGGVFFTAPEFFCSCKACPTYVV